MSQSSWAATEPEECRDSTIKRQCKSSRRRFALDAETLSAVYRLISPCTSAHRNPRKTLPPFPSDGGSVCWVLCYGSGLEAAVGGVAGVFAAFQDSFVVAVICHVFSLLLLVCAAGEFVGGVLLLYPMHQRMSIYAELFVRKSHLREKTSLTSRRVNFIIKKRFQRASVLVLDGITRKQEVLL